MGEYDGQNRPLPWDLRFSERPENTTEDDAGTSSSFIWPEDPDEKVIVPFYLSQHEWTVLGSTIDVGRDIAYGPDSIRVLWLWLRNMRVSVPLCAAIIECITSDADTQQAIADLISTNEAVQEAIRNFVSTDTQLTNYFENSAAQVTTKILSQLELGRNILKPDACDYGYTFHSASVLVELLDSLTRDMFESIEVGSNHLERAELLVSAIPGVGILPFDELLRLADDLVENVSEDYNGAYDEGLYDDIRCALWCTIRNECEMSIDDAFEFYEARLGTSLPQNPVEGLLGVLQFLDSGDFPGDLIVYGMHLLVLAAMRAGGDYLGIDFARLGLRITAAGDDADNDWETLCEECVPDPETCIDFTFHLSSMISTDGVNTGLEAISGGKVTITATGTFSTYYGGPEDQGPQGREEFQPWSMEPDNRVYSLMARIEGDTEWFEVGADGEFFASHEGDVYVIINGEAAHMENPQVTYLGTLELEVCTHLPETCFDFAIDEQGWTAPSELHAQYDDEVGWKQDQNTWLTIDSTQANLGVHSVTITFIRDWLGTSDAEKYTVNLYNWGGSGNLQHFGNLVLLTENPVTLTTTGSDWIDLRLQVAGGGLTFPDDQGILSVCYNET